MPGRIPLDGAISMNIALRRRLILIAALVAAIAAGPTAAQSLAGKLVLYTSQPERDAAQTVGAFKKVHPGSMWRSSARELPKSWAS